MSTTGQPTPQVEGFRFTRGVRRRLLQIAAMILLQAAALFASAGTLRWMEGWAYLGLYLVLIGLNAALIVPKGSAGLALIEERSETSAMHAWDKIFAGLYGVSGVAVLVIAGLDERFGWSTPSALWLQVVGAVAVCLGYGLFSWSMAVNAYFSARVRIQTDRGHRVVEGGPYTAVRHPGYVGAMISTLALPVMFASRWAMLPSAGVVIALIARTALEDRTLSDGLEGYRDYTRRVRYRLVPGVW